MKRTLYEDLAAGVSGLAEHVIVGLNWTLVVGPNGAGMAQTPARGTAGCRSLPSPGTYSGKPLATLAALWTSENIFERTIADRGELSVCSVQCSWD